MEIESMKNNGMSAYQSGKAASQPGGNSVSSRAGVENIELNTSTKTDESSRDGRETPIDTRDKNENAQTNQNQTLKNAVEEMNKQMQDSEAIFGIHDKTNRVTIKIVDKETKEVIKEYPPEQTLDMIAKVWELAGIMVDEKR